MANKKKLTLRQQYQKQITRLQKYQKRYEKLGYKFEQPLAPELPKRVTKQKLKEIQEFKPRKIKGEEAIALRGTGEILSQYKPEPTPVSEEPVYGYIQSVEDLINNLPEVRFVSGIALEIVPIKSLLLNALYDTLAQYGTEEEYERYLSTVYTNIQEDLEIVTYASNQVDVQSGVDKALHDIQGGAMTYEQAIKVSNYQENLGYE